MKSRLIVNSILSLLVGCFIYLFFRDPSLIFFGWIDDVGLSNSVMFFQETMSLTRTDLPNWFLYSLPDGLWLFSYVCIMLHVWRKSMRWMGFIWTLISPIIAVSFELSQLINPSLGTFDWSDLLFYTFATIIPFVIFRKRINFSPNSILSYEE